MFTGYVVKRFANRIQVLEGIGTCGGDFAVTKNHVVIFHSTDRDEAEMVAEMQSEN